MKKANCTEYPKPLLPTATGLLLAALMVLASPNLPAQDQASTKQAIAAEKTPDGTVAGPPPGPQTENDQTQSELPRPGREEREMQLLAAGQPKNSVVWLKAMGLPFLALYEPDYTGNPVGAILILNAEGQHSSWPGTSEQIRLSLPQFGWNTLSTQLPAPQSSPIPPRDSPQAAVKDPAETATAEDSSNATPDTEQPQTETLPDKEADAQAAGVDAAGATDNTQMPEVMPIDAEELSLARLRRSIDYLHEQGQFNIVLIGNGLGAVRAACYLRELPSTSNASQSRLVRALILVNARNRVPTTDTRLQNCLEDPDMPVLDVFAGQQARDQIEAEERLKASRRNGIKRYQQLHFPEMGETTSRGENLLSRRIRGFLDRYARGVKVENAVINR